jgi:hypothetical protein
LSVVAALDELSMSSYAIHTKRKLALQRRKGFNPKRDLAPPDRLNTEGRRKMAKRVVYSGSPFHKKSPGDYGLTPATAPRPGKTLCDANGEFLLAEAQALIRAGIKKGMVSGQFRGDWPQNIWAVNDAGEAFEAELENKEGGHYHGYPMPLNDPFLRKVLEEWRRR